MVDAVESMAYAGEVPWHGLGKPVSNKLTPAQMQKEAGLDWKVEKRKLHFPVGNGMQEIKDKYALVRDKDNALLSIVGSTYKPVQNDEAVGFFKKFVEAGHMNMETMGSLQNGQYIWSLARIGKDFKLAGGDEVRGFLLLCQPHVIGKAMVIQFTPIRVVCWNTLSFALGADLKGKGNAFRMPHSMKFDDSVKKKAEEALGLSKHQMDEFKDMSTLLSKKRAKDADVETYFRTLLKFKPEEAAQIAAPSKSKKKAKAEAEMKDEAADKEPRMLNKLRLALTNSPGASLQSAAGTWWGAVNAVTFVIDHEIGRDRSASLRTAWLGAKAGLKRKAVALAVEMAK